MKISFYDTFIVQNFKIAHFSHNNYKGIILKIGVQNQRNQLLRYFYRPKLLNSSFLPK